MVVQFTNDGNIIKLALNFSLIGLIAKTTCTFLRTAAKYILNMFSGVWSTPCSWQSFLAFLFCSSKSGASYKFGMSPVLRTPFMSSSILSWIICVSTNRNVVWILAAPACIKHFFISSFQFFSGL